jgi:hypothetical protein
MGESDIFTNSWIYPDKYQQLLGCYLFIVCCISLVRTVGLALRLWSFRRKEESLSVVTGNVETIANAVLKGKIGNILKPSHEADAITISSILFMVDCIETEFRYLWENCYAKVRATKTLIALTVILLFFISAIEIDRSCWAIKYEEASVGIAALAGAGQEIFFCLARGLGISAFFYALSRWFEMLLMRRRTQWDYYKSKLQQEFASNNSPR